MKNSSSRCGSVAVVACLASLAFYSFAANSSEPPSNWPQWRSPGGQGISEEQNLPEEWSATQNVRWKIPIEGRGHSCPVIWGKRLFLTTSLEGPLVPGHKAAKHIGWQGEDNYVHPDACGADHSWTMKVLCIDTESGNILWEKTSYEGTVYDNRNRNCRKGPFHGSRHV